MTSYINRKEGTFTYLFWHFWFLYMLAVRNLCNQGTPCNQSTRDDVCSRWTFIHTVNTLWSWRYFADYLNFYITTEFIFMCICVYIFLYYSSHRCLYHPCASCVHTHTYIHRGQEKVCEHNTFRWAAERGRLKADVGMDGMSWDSLLLMPIFPFLK